MVSIKEVAEIAGVSTATVSRVLADKPYVRAEVRDHVLAVVEELNYRPNRVARSLRAQKSNIIGLIVSDIQNPFFTLISRAVEDAAYEHGMSIFLCNTDEDPAKEAMCIKLMRDERVAGIILSPSLKTSNNFIEITNSHLPVVVIEQPTFGIGRTAVELLVSRIQDPTRATREVTLKNRLIIRRSCGCRK
jgi:LacI family fructose operon transcriptional repressor